MIHRNVTSATIARPIEDVFDWVTTPGNWPGCSPITLGIESDDPARPVRAGDRFQQHVHVNSWRGSFDWTVEVLDRPHRCVLSAAGKGETLLSRLAGKDLARVEYTFASDGTATKVTHDLQIHVGGLAALVSDVEGLGDAVDRAARITLATMKSVLENPLLRGPQPDPSSETLLHEADPLADEAVASMVTNGDCTALEQMLAALYRGDPPSQEMPEPMRRLMHDTMTVPAWACQPYLDAAADVFLDWILQAVGAHICASLPETYVMPRVAKLLGLTSQLDGSAHQVDRRIWFTVRMCTDVLDRKGLEPGGRGLLAIQRLRLIHASIRLFATHRMQSSTRLSRLTSTAMWDTENGQPISQLELLHTLLTFSHVVVRSLEILGCNLTPYQREAYIHRWNVAGALIGVRPDLLPRTAADAAAAFDAIKSKHANATGDAARLGRSLIDFWTDILPLTTREDALRLMNAVLKALLSPETIQMNGLADLPEFQPEAAGRVKELLQIVDDLEADIFSSAFGRQAVALFTTLVLRAATQRFEHDSGMWNIPAELASRWQPTQ
jgi:carbon monoxide dehydrogenase subunit G